MSQTSRRQLLSPIGKLSAAWLLCLCCPLLNAIPGGGWSPPPPPAKILVPTAPTHSTGSFDISWQDTTGSICWLAERVDQGTWAAVADTYTPTRTIRLTRSPGSYEYQVNCLGTLGPIATVTVATTPPPVLDPLETQRDYQYQVRTGDINADGRKDLYVKRSSGGVAGNGVLESAILLQDSAGQFDPLTNPTSSQTSAANSWAIASNVLAMVSDLNVDGYVDVLIKNLGNAIDNVDDQILYSAAKVFNGNARSVTAVTEEFQMFFRDAFKGIFDSNYFNQAITPAQPALSYGLVYGAQACYYFYGFPFCASYARHAILEIFTLAELGLSAVDEAQAKTALAEHFGLPDYDAYVCTFICALQVYYSYNSSIAVFAYDTFLPTTVGPGFDDVNFSAKASDFVDVFADIFDSGVFIPNSAKIIRVGEMIEEVLGVEILGGVFGSGTVVYQDGEIGMDERSIVPDLLSALDMIPDPVDSPPPVANVLIVNPLPGSSINRKNRSGGNCTSDGRFDPSGALRSGSPHHGVDLGSGASPC